MLERKRSVMLLLPVAALALATAVTAARVTLSGIYNTVHYRVEPQASPPAINYAVFALLAVVVAVPLALAARRPVAAALQLLAVSWAPLVANAAVLVAGRLLEAPLYLAPIVLALSAGASVALAIWTHCKGSSDEERLDASGAPADSKRPSRLPGLLAVVLTVVAAVHLYMLQDWFLAKLSFGWTDVGLYYLRVKNTALGNGFLQETMARPTFYDHFNPGLAVLAPVYYLVRSFDVIMWAQSLFLAAVGPAVYVYARGRGLGSWTSLVLGVAALCHPSISQMAFSFSYGFHPVTMALPAVVLSIHFWEKNRHAAFVLCALFACSMEETVFPLYAGLGLVELLFTRGRRIPGAVLLVASTALFLVVIKFIMPAAAGDAEYFQFAKFAHLGGSVKEILFAPFTKPEVFWGLIFSRKSLVFLALILGSMAFLPLMAPRRFLYPAVVLAFVLLLDNPDVKSISFWYQGLVLVTWFTAMAAAVAGLQGARWKGAAFAAASGVLVTSVCAAHFYGMLPWSRVTVPFQVKRGPEFMAGAAGLRRFALSLPGDARVLATMRAATYFCDAGAVSPLQDWDKTVRYDVVVIQRDDGWGQTAGDMKAVFEAFAGSGEFDFQQKGSFLVFTRRRAGPGASP